MPIFIFLALMALAQQAFAHAGHADAPGAQDNAPAQTITLSETALHNLGIQTEKAEIKDIAKTVRLNALVDALPDHYAQMTSKVPSRVMRVAVQSGQNVKAGDTLAVIQPLLVGSTFITLTAPIDGVIVRQSALSGQTTLPENPLFEIAELSTVLVRGQAYETSDLAALKIGQGVTISSSAYPDKIFTGTIERIDAALNRTTRTLDVFAKVANADRLLLKNMQVAMHIDISKKTQGLVVPRRAILGDSGNRFLFIKDGNNFERRDIKLGIITGNHQEVLEGVFPDEEIVVVGQYQLQYASPTAPARHKD
jgi:membrane fusion protein, heavy metal efflux system